MPIYEFTCERCRTIFSFLARRAGTPACPLCPRCGRTLSREVSLFAATRGGAREEEAGGEGPDDPRMDAAMAGMAEKLEGIDDSDPAAAAKVMRQFAAESGVRFNRSIEDALARMEAGEDPEALESELGDALEDESPFATDEAGAGPRRQRTRIGPTRDPRLYDL